MSETKSKFEQGYELFKRLKSKSRKVIIKRLVDDLEISKATANTYYFQYTKIVNDPNHKLNKSKKREVKNNWLQADKESSAPISNTKPVVEDVQIWSEQRALGKTYVIRPIFKDADRNDQEYVISQDDPQLAERIAAAMRNGKLFDKPYFSYDNKKATYVVWNNKVPSYDQNLDFNLRRLGV